MQLADKRLACQLRIMLLIHVYHLCLTNRFHQNGRMAGSIGAEQLCKTLSLSYKTSCHAMPPNYVHLVTQERLVTVQAQAKQQVCLL